MAVYDVEQPQYLQYGQGGDPRSFGWIATVISAVISIGMEGYKAIKGSEATSRAASDAQDAVSVTRVAQLQNDQAVADQKAADKKKADELAAKIDKYVPVIAIGIGAMWMGGLLGKKRRGK